jgi:hypothetical protein
MGVRREPNITYVNAKCGLAKTYAAECHKALESLQPEGTHLGLLELCKAAMQELNLLRKEVGNG